MNDSSLGILTRRPQNSSRFKLFAISRSLKRGSLDIVFLSQRFKTSPSRSFEISVRDLYLLVISEMIWQRSAADTKLAWLTLNRSINGIHTEDSDLVLHDAKSILNKVDNDKMVIRTIRKLLRDYGTHLCIVSVPVRSVTCTFFQTFLLSLIQLPKRTSVIRSTFWNASKQASHHKRRFFTMFWL